MLKKPTEHFGKQVGVPGAYWEGRMGAEERKTRFMCTMREFELNSSSTSGKTAARRRRRSSSKRWARLRSGAGTHECYLCP